MSGASGPGRRGTLVEMPVMLGMHRTGPRQRVHRPVQARPWWACAKRSWGRSSAGLFSLVMVADPVLVFGGGGLCDGR